MNNDKYLFNVGDTFVYNGQKGKVIRIAQIDEFGADFYFAEKNYVVKFDFNDKAHASYNFAKFEGDKLIYHYVMTQSDMKKIE
jgi:hypothetical protein